MQTILVTGGAGFIGSHLVERLIKEGYKVIVYDNLLTGDKKNLLSIAGKYDFVQGSVEDLGLLRKVSKNIDYIFHLAAVSSVKLSIENPLLCDSINISGTLNVLIAAKENGVKRVILSSSSAVYGANGISPKREELMSSPLSPYALGKLAGEYYASVFYLNYGLETISLRYFNVYGPRQNPNSSYAAVIPAFIDSLLNEKNAIIYGNGSQTRDFIYVADVVNANILAMKASRNALGRSINIGSSQEISIKKLYYLISSTLKISKKPQYGFARVGDIKHSVSDISLAKKLLNFVPTYSLSEGLLETAQWFTSDVIKKAQFGDFEGIQILVRKYLRMGI